VAIFNNLEFQIFWRFFTKYGLRLSVKLYVFI
jgi:hypothetical protein